MPNICCLTLLLCYPILFEKYLFTRKLSLIKEKLFFRNNYVNILACVCCEGPSSRAFQVEHFEADILVVKLLKVDILSKIY